MNYKTYAEAKIANPDSEIVTTGENWKWAKHAIGTFLACNSGIKRSDNQDGWVICNPADYCLSVKEFLEAGFKLSPGDLFTSTDGCLGEISGGIAKENEIKSNDDKRYILSAASLNGRCKIPAKAEQWSVYNNTLTLCELSDEQAAMLFNSWRGGLKVELLADDGSWCGAVPDWSLEIAYRIKPKSERELFIGKSLSLMTSETERTMEQMFGAQFDAGARYTDLTQHFGENI